MHPESVLLGLAIGIVAAFAVSLGAIVLADHYIHRGRGRRR